MKRNEIAKTLNKGNKQRDKALKIEKELIHWEINLGRENTRIKKRKNGS